MVALSIELPAKLALASQEAAYKLGISHSQFIRQAIVHELARFEKEAMDKHITQARTIL